MNGNGKHFLEFGDFRLEPESSSLWRSGVPVDAPQKVIEVLILLASNHGEVVSRETLLDTVWKDTFVEEGNINYTISLLRKTLGDQEFIQTVPRRGYRFNLPPIQVAPIGIQIEAPPDAGLKTYRRFVYGFVVIAFSAVAIVSVWLLTRRSSADAASGTPAAAETVSLRRLTFTGDAGFPVLSPDGRSFAFVRDSKIIVQDVDSGQETALVIESRSGFGFLQFSPDGEAIYFREAGSPSFAGNIYRVSRFGGRAEMVVEKVAGGVGFSFDGKQMAFMRFDPRLGEGPVLILRMLANGAERRLMSFPQESYLLNGRPAFSTDGKKIALVIFNRFATNLASRLAIFDLNTNSLHDIATPRLRQIEQPVWLYGDNELVLSAREPGKFLQLWRIETATGKVKRLTNDLNSYRGISVSADGKRLLAQQASAYTNIWIANSSDLGRPVQKTFENLNRDGMRGISWTSDGNVVYNSRMSGDQDIFLFSVDGERRQLTKNIGDQNQHPISSPDGRQIYFSSNRTGSVHIWRLDLVSGEQTQVTSGKEDVETFPQLSPQGSILYYLRRGPAGRFVVRRDLKDGGETLLTSESLVPAGPLVVSPSGQFLAFLIHAGVGDEEETAKGIQVGIIKTADSANLITLPIAATRPAFDWSPDGMALDYVENSDAGGRVIRQPIDGSPPIVLTAYPDKFLHAFSWSHDGSQLGLALGKQSTEAILVTDF